MEEARIASLPPGPEKEAALMAVAAKKEAAAIAAEEARVASMPPGAAKDKAAAACDARKETNATQLDSIREATPPPSPPMAESGAATTGQASLEEATDAVTVDETEDKVRPTLLLMRFLVFAL